MLLPRCLVALLFLAIEWAAPVRAAEGQNEWQKTVDAAKKEGTVVFATAADVSCAGNWNRRSSAALELI